LGATELKQFQEQVSDLLLRHRSLLDVLSKFDQSNASVHRSIVKSVTECGCIEMNAAKQDFSDSMTLEEAKDTLKTHITGSLCDNCSDSVMAQLGKNVFYMTALCNLLDIDLQKVLEEESKKCSTLGLFNLS
jgi:NTP pyrophosphatase (non-canonical NTP hydrolase)